MLVFGLRGLLTLDASENCGKAPLRVLGVHAGTEAQYAVG
jgi:hypothetical protein